MLLPLFQEICLSRRRTCRFPRLRSRRLVVWEVRHRLCRFHRREACCRREGYHRPALIRFRIRMGLVGPILWVDRLSLQCHHRRAVEGLPELEKDMHGYLLLNERWLSHKFGGRMRRAVNRLLDNHGSGGWNIQCHCYMWRSLSKKVCKRMVLLSRT